MNYTGMLAEVTGGVEKLPAAKALVYFRCWKGTSSQLSKLGPRRNSANPVCMCFVDLKKAYDPGGTCTAGE